MELRWSYLGVKGGGDSGKQLQVAPVRQYTSFHPSTTWLSSQGFEKLGSPTLALTPHLLLGRPSSPFCVAFGLHHLVNRAIMQAWAKVGARVADHTLLEGQMEGSWTGLGLRLTVESFGGGIHELPQQKGGEEKAARSLHCYELRVLRHFF